MKDNGRNKDFGLSPNSSFLPLTRVNTNYLCLGTEDLACRMKSTMQCSSWWCLLGLSALLAGCGTVSEPATTAEQQAQTQQSCHPEPLRGVAALAGPFTDINPRQALQGSAQGARVCWGGGLRTLEAVSAERDCMVLLQAESKGGYLSWPREATFFKACGRGAYDRQLLQPFTLVWISGKVTGQAEFTGTPIPVIEIDALYRSSDCLEGDTAPQCVHSYLQPLRKPQ